jgi:UDP-GlcNAc:undecaprenyl-phosphate/decaprenyl-phosphate GlcNAc-1-phosphate transferase
MSPGLAFATAFVLTLVLTPLAALLGRRLGLIDRPGGRREHRGVIPRLGGLALFAGFFGTSLLIFLLTRWPPPEISRDRHLLTGVLVGAVFVFLFGLVDDVLALPAWPQFVAQIGAAGLAIYYTVFIQQVTLPIWGFTEFEWWITYPVTIFWVMGMLNTVNWLDGLDGLAAGVTAIAALLFAFHAFRLGQTTVALFPIALAGACLGFLPFNFHPARVFMGTAGSMTLGWALASLSILAPAKVATALLVLGLPIIDVAWLILLRWRRGRSPVRGGRDHLHFRLLDLGLTQRQIVLLYYSFCLSFGLLALIISSRIFKLVTLVVLGLLALGALWWLSREPELEAG